MPAATPRYALPYALLGDQPHGPNQEQALAQAVETALGIVDDFAHAAASGGEYAASALQALTTGLNKLTFGTTVRAAAGITWNGSNQFTTTAAGVYAITASVYLPGTSNMNCFTGTSAASLNANVHVHGVFAGGGLSASSGGARYLDVGTTISAYCYLNSANVNTSFSTEPATFNVWKVA